MFRQSIDPRGGFPPRASRKSKPKKAKKGLKKRKSKKQSFERERKAEQVFRFGEVRSGLSGRSVYNPNDFIRFHQSAQFNQQRDEAERTRRGGTFTGTSIGEEKKVREAQEVDRRFKERQLRTQERFAGALEKFVGRIPTVTQQQQIFRPPPQQQQLPAPTQQQLPAPRQDTDIQDIKPLPIQDTGLQRLISGSSVGVADIEEVTPTPRPEPLLREVKIDSPIPERRKPEDDLNVQGSVKRESRQPTSIPVQDRPRPTPSNPSKTSTIKDISFEERLAQQSKPREIELTEEEQQEIRDKIYQGLIGEPPPQTTTTETQTLTPATSTQDESRARELASKLRETLQPTSGLPRQRSVEPEEGVPKLTPTPVKEIRERQVAKQPEPEPEPEGLPLVSVLTPRTQEAVAEGRAEFVPTRQPEPEPEPEPEPAQAGGQLEEIDTEEQNWLDSLPDKSQFHSGKGSNELIAPTFSFVDTEGVVGRGKFKGRELIIAGINKKGNVLVQLKDTVGKGKVGDEVRGNISYKKFVGLVDDLDLKPVQPTE